MNGSSRSTIRIKVPVSYTQAFTQDANTQGTNVHRICPLSASSFYPSALNSALYRTYCNLYDEVKVVGMKVQLNVSSQVGGNDIPSLQIYTAFDRRNAYDEARPTFSDLKTYSTFAVATAVNNSVAKLQRSLYASDLLEKAQWHDCSLSLAGGVYEDDAYKTSDNNPNFFIPAMFICMAIPNVTVQTTVNATVDVMYYFSFRNPKYGASAAAKQRLEVENLDVRVAPGDPGDADDPGLMDMGDLSIEDDVAAEVPRRPVTALTSSRSTSSLVSERRAADRAIRRPNV